MESDKTLMAVVIIGCYFLFVVVATLLLDDIKNKEVDEGRHADEHEDNAI